jgi:hypothetical protein
MEAGLARQGAEIETVPTAGIENGVSRRCAQDPGDGVEQRPGHAEIVQSPPPRDGSRCVAGLLRSPVLRLEQVDVSATRDVERMPARTDQAPVLARQRHSAVADRAEKHASSVMGHRV